MTNIQLIPPSECRAAQLAQFKTLVLRGEEVTQPGLEERIKAAKSLAFAFDDGRVVGVGALKIPSLQHKEDVFRRAGVKSAAATHDFEIGWLFVDDEYRKRGHGNSLVGALLEVADTAPVFATVRAANMGMKKILYQFGFSECGEPFASRRGNYQLSLLTHPAIED